MIDEPRQLLSNGEAIAHLQNVMQFGIEALIELPNSILRLIRTGAWQKRIVPTIGRTVEYAPDEFPKFVNDPIPDGLGITIASLQDICRSRPDVLDAIDNMLHTSDEPRRQINSTSEVSTKTSSKSSTAKALRRLEKERPDLHKRVLDREISANAAMIEAGFWKHKITVPTGDVEAAARVLRRNFTPEELAALKEILL